MQDIVTLQNYTNQSTNSKEARDLRAKLMNRYLNIKL